MSVHRLSGNWCGVCHHGLARKVGDQLVVSRLDTPNTPLWVRHIGSARWLDCASNPDTTEIRVVYTRSTGTQDDAYLMRHSGPEVQIAQKTLTVLLRFREGRWLALVAFKDSSWKVLDAETLQIVKQGSDPQWSTGGLLDLSATLTPIWRAPRNHVTFGTQKVEYPTHAGPWTAGQGSKPSTLLVGYRSTVRELLRGEAREAKVVQLPNGHAAICSRVEQGYGVAFTVLSPEQFLALPKPQSPPVPPEQDDDTMTDAQWKQIDAFMKNTRDALGELNEKVDELRELIEETPDQPGPTPEPPPGAPVIDLKQVVWLHTDVSDWKETSRITDVTIEHPKNGDPDNGTVCFPHTKAGVWPTFDNGTGEGNVWVFGFVNGKWHAATAEWLKPGQICKRFSNRTEPLSWGIGPHTKKDPLKSWGPQSGEWIGLMVSTRARDNDRSRDGNGNPVLERSNVVVVQWP